MYKRVYAIHAYLIKANSFKYCRLPKSTSPRSVVYHLVSLVTFAYKMLLFFSFSSLLRVCQQTHDDCNDRYDTMCFLCAVLQICMHNIGWSMNVACSSIKLEKRNNTVFSNGRQFYILRFMKWMLFELYCVKWQMIRKWRTILFSDEKRKEKNRSNMRAISKCEPNPTDRISVNSNQIYVHNNSFELMAS